ncbi:MAG: MAPEG family protein [Betaproteobacteria bacterium]|nr:MAG: MAPEG family protein [Betaproteobacteria bacterium]
MTVTALYAGSLALWFLVLSYRVVGRRRAGISLGDGGDPGMLRVVRGHANFAEYVPLALIMLAILELGGTSPLVLHALGLALLAGRLLHGYALSFTQQFGFGRFWGTLLTYGILVVEALLCLHLAVLR